MNIGDKVRFLNDVGGGKITAFRPNGVVLVEDEDGFDIPMLASEVVVVESSVVETKKKPAPRVEYGVEPVGNGARNGGKEKGDEWNEKGNEGKEKMSIDGMQYLRNKTAVKEEDEAVDENLEARVTRLEITIRRLEMRLARLEDAKAAKEKEKAKARMEHKKEKNEIIEIDLHAHELLDTMAGMSKGDIKDYQMEVFRKTMQAHLHEKGRRIVFIHGKGEGVLRKAITDELKRSFKTCEYQDASFQQYGFGATMVIIH